MTPQEKKAIDTMRALAMDAVQQAKSGHPGAPMSLTPVTYLLYNERMKYDPKRPNWPGRDRFVLSNGHASTLLYSTLHVAGVRALDEKGVPTSDPAVSLDDLNALGNIFNGGVAGKNESANSVAALCCIFLVMCL